ncbi:DUF2938 domain-containing protein [Chimaeribacter californicus]|uniref:DUF2938 domain-containing protein n=1 Tax=Chimaeribacter californicus TaxID=2060067 RepID=A0A2N5DWP3_9GAMM|nr:DUF2938 domain-containing protein [Chimaeribacter californicus]PLR31666.1 DUF2938 domain-containing protein [Chimaeribacter californicus]
MAESLLGSVWVGIGATGVMDLWALVQRVAFGTPSLDYALVGRWLALMRDGRFCHRPIMAAPPVKGERLLGWLCHYAIGIMFAALLVAAAGPQWLHQPTLLPALLAGVLSLAAPFFILQPALGFGVAASRTPAPATARLRSVKSHLAFGLGLYLAAEVGARVWQ